MSFRQRGRTLRGQSTQCRYFFGSVHFWWCIPCPRVQWLCSMEVYSRAQRSVIDLFQDPISIASSFQGPELRGYVSQCDQSIFKRE